VAVAQAEIVRQLQKPALDDRATQLELALPFNCISSPQAFDMNALLQDLQSPPIVPERSLRATGSINVVQ